MTTRSGLPAALLVFGLCIPLAVFVGFQLATPTSFGSYAFVLLLLSSISLPLLLKWHHFLLVASWNAAVLVFFLPGQPSLGVFMAFVSLGLSILTRTLTQESQFKHVPSVSYPIVAMIIVVLLTAMFTGGIHGRSMGYDVWGAKRYLCVLGAGVGYFALTSHDIPYKHAGLYAAVFCLTGVTALISDLIYAAGPSLYFLYAMFPANVAFHQAVSETTLHRLTGPSWAAMAILSFMVIRYGVAGIFDLRKFWRLPVFLALVGLSMVGGFRSIVILLTLFLVVQFYYEGLARTKLLPIFISVGILAFLFIVVFSEHLPLSVQRSISFLPVEVHPMARQDADGTLDWRLQMWKTVIPDVPKYLLIGKGFSFSGVDFELTKAAMSRSSLSAFEDTLVSGNYHNGILTVLIPFGLGGGLAFLFFCWGSIKVLYANYRYSDPQLKLINTFLLSKFVAQLAFYLTLYGQFDLDFVLFTGLVGFSICINHGVRKPNSLGDLPSIASSQIAAKSITHPSPIS